jgi:hypothetical protein
VARFVEQSLVLVEDEWTVRVIGLDELIAVKSPIGRAQDRAVLPYLEAIRRRR